MSLSIELILINRGKPWKHETSLCPNPKKNPFEKYVFGHK